MIVSGEPLLSPWLLLRALATQPDVSLYSDRPGGLSDRLGGRPQLFAYGREALAEALRSLGAGTGQILVPAYICDTVVDGVNAAGWRLRYYPLGDRLVPDWDWLERKRHPADTAILLVHYFGFPSDLERAARFAQRHRLALIEDCAHAFLTVVTNPVVGRTGAAAIYSWRKFLPVANGGALVQAANLPRGTRHKQKRLGAVATTRELGKWLLFESRSRFLLNRFGSRLSDEPVSSTPPVATVVAVPDGIALRVLAAETPNLSRVAQKRRDNYRTLFDSLSRFSSVAMLTPPLPDDVVPWCLAARVPGDSERDRLVDHLLRHGIGAWSWPELPADVTGGSFPRESHLAAETVCLPIHHDLGERHLRHITMALDDWESGQ